MRFLRRRQARTLQRPYLYSGLRLPLQRRVAWGSMQDRQWHLITDDELTALLLERGCAHVEGLVQGRDTIAGDEAVEKALSRPPRAV